MRLFYEITKKDIGKRFIQITKHKCPTCGDGGITELVNVGKFMGAIQAQDVGKRIYNVSGEVYQVENQEQLEKRLNKKFN